MANVLVVSMPFAGHVGPMSAVAAEMIRRGHQVTAYTGAKYRERFTSVGAAWLPWTKAADYDDADLAATFPQVGDGKGMRGDRANLEHVVFGTAPGQAADILAAGPFDLLVTDQIALGGAVAGQALGIPWATVAVTPLSLTSENLPPVGAPWTPGTGPAGRLRDAGFRKLAGLVCRWMVDPKLNKLRAGVGLGPVPSGRLFDGLYSPHLVLAQGVPGLEYPRADLPRHVHFVGRLAPPARAGAAAELPAWWPDLAAARTVVHVTQGTLDVDPNDLLKPAIAALAAPGFQTTEANQDRPDVVARPAEAARQGAWAGDEAPAEGEVHIGNHALAGENLQTDRDAVVGDDLQAGRAASVGRDRQADRDAAAGGGLHAGHEASGDRGPAAGNDPLDGREPQAGHDPSARRGDPGRPDAQGVLVVCTTGGADPAVLGPLPANVRAAAFLPHDLLLPEVDVIVTNGGWGGVLAAVQSGIPLVVAGASLDKPEVARRVAWSGTGRNLRTGKPKPARIAQAVRDVTTQPKFRARARELGSAMTAAGGTVTAADLLEDLLVR